MNVNQPISLSRIWIFSNCVATFLISIVGFIIGGLAGEVDSFLGGCYQALFCIFFFTPLALFGSLPQLILANRIKKRKSIPNYLIWNYLLYILPVCLINILYYKNTFFDGGFWLFTGILLLHFSISFVIWKQQLRLVQNKRE